jgi:hypothetical protein
MADQHRRRHDFQDDFLEAFERQTGREGASLVDQQFREMQGQFVRKMRTRSRAIDSANTRRFSPPYLPSRTLTATKAAMA